MRSVSTDCNNPSEYGQVRRIVDEVASRVAPRAHAVFVRTPVIDPDFAGTSDLDFIVFSDVEELYPERLEPAAADGDQRRIVDLTWLPAAWLNDPEFLSAHGLIAHRLATSTLVFGADDQTAAQAAVTRNFYRPDIQQRRLSGFLELGSLTVREIGVTWDFPALALFWLHMAHTACLAAALDGLRRHCPNVYTRPFGYLAELDAIAGADFASEWTRTLCLDADPAEAIVAVRRVREIVARQFPEPAWPASMRAATRFEYRYWLRREESEWRISVAEEMCRHGHAAAALHYLRFLAYALARVPMIHARAAEGRDVSYLRPEKAVGPDLSRLCPAILGDLNTVLAGRRAPLVTTVERALASLHVFRERVVEILREWGAPVPTLTPWTPYRPAPRDRKEAPCQI